MENKYFILGQIYAIYEVVLAESNITMFPIERFWKIPKICIALAEGKCHQRNVIRNYMKYEIRLGELFSTLHEIPETFPDANAKSDMTIGYYSEKRRMKNK